MSSAIMPTYARNELAFERGEGPYLFTREGRRFLDLGTGIAVTSLGHCHPALVAALQKQAETLWHVSNLYTIPEGERFAQRLTGATSFADRVFFCNSGAEASEGCIKVARKYQSAIGHPERYRVITCDNAFHGRTIATMAATGSAKVLDGFGPKVDAFDHVPFGNMNALRAAIAPETAAIMVEPVQGEGGINLADEGYLQDLRAAADEFGLLLMFDEVQCGVGRTGKMFAHQHTSVTPDVMALAKGLGGGFPMGAVLASEKAAQGMQPGSHGSTFGGNPMAMAVGNAILDVLLAEGFFDQMNAVADRFWSLLHAFQAKNSDVLAAVRGKGLMMGLQPADPITNMDLVKVLQTEGVLSVPAGGNITRFLPPLIITDQHVDEAMAALDKAVQALRTQKEKAA